MTGERPQGQWADSTRERYDRIVRLHIDASADASTRPIGSCKLRDLSMDRVAAGSQANERALAPTTASIVLITLKQVCGFAVRRDWLADNPVAKLEPGEKPHWTPQKVAILEGDELARFLAHAGPQRPLFEFLAYTGLRIGEALGLTWADIDHDAGRPSARPSNAAASPPPANPTVTLSTYAHLFEQADHAAAARAALEAGYAATEGPTAP